MLKWFNDIGYEVSIKIADQSFIDRMDEYLGPKKSIIIGDSKSYICIDDKLVGICNFNRPEYLEPIIRAYDKYYDSLISII